MRRALRLTTFRRSFDTTTPLVYTTSVRFGGARAPIPVDSNPILAAQQQRTVSAVTPGKLFMLNWIAHEQSAASISNRVVSVGVLLGGGVLVGLYGVSLTSYGVIPMLLLFVFPSYFMYMHMGYTWQVAVPALLLYLLMLFGN